MNLSLSIADRLTLSSWMPHTGDFQTVVTAKSIDDKIAFTEDENKRYQFETVEGGLKYNAVDENLIQVDFYKEEVSLVLECIESLDKSGRITRDMLPLIYQFKQIKTA